VCSICLCTKHYIMEWNVWCFVLYVFYCKDCSNVHWWFYHFSLKSPLQRLQPITHFVLPVVFTDKNHEKIRENFLSLSLKKWKWEYFWRNWQIIRQFWQKYSHFGKIVSLFLMIFSQFLSVLPIVLWISSSLLAASWYYATSYHPLWKSLGIQLIYSH